MEGTLELEIDALVIKVVNVQCASTINQKDLTVTRDTTLTDYLGLIGVAKRMLYQPILDELRAEGRQQIGLQASDFDKKATVGDISDLVYTAVNKAIDDPDKVARTQGFTSDFVGRLPNARRPKKAAVTKRPRKTKAPAKKKPAKNKSSKE